MLAWRGAPAVRIRGRGQRLAADRLQDAAVPALYAALGGEFEAIEMQPVGGFDGINVPAGKVRLAARVPASQRPARRMSALVDVSVDGSVYTTVPVWFSVRASRPALLARVPLRPGEPVRAGDFQVQTVDVAANAAPALRGNAPLEGLQLRRAIEPGMVLSAAHVEERPSVARNEQVKVRVVQGSVTIETTGQALADARVGEVIKVRGAGSGEPYPARVVADGVVLAGGR
jgi:flagella basal body P-ring formation protein FlgA